MPAIHVVDFDPVRVAREVYDDVFRRDWSDCGFALITDFVESNTVACRGDASGGYESPP